MQEGDGVDWALVMGERKGGRGAVVDGRKGGGMEDRVQGTTIHKIIQRGREGRKGKGEIQAPPPGLYL